MKRIDRETVQKILDTADIVDVVSDFVTLKRRGANYIGLCPFHNERTPSFSVSKSKGICKCFSCGKGGSPVNFLMELEQMSFNDAIRWLAKKYNIEIQEHELSDAERQQATQRESMFAVNDYAMEHFERNLSATTDGKEIGYAYFRDRGISDSAIKRFHLGYALDQPTALYDSAVAKGYSAQSLFDTGLSIKQENGRVYDRFKGRVIYPVFTISGKVVAFGGRTLRSDKKVAKYVNSPESVIYTKSRELYGLYQAKNAIVRQDKCILVEGYMDVISMAQSGVENVVASSGTSLTEGQIRLIHRFTSNVTVIYDSDPAGIKASLRGIDMLLAEGLQIKVVLLPDGDDPDSFAQTHTATEVEEYIREHEVDFIRFKTRILTAGMADDPLQRANVITDIVKSISVIPDEIMRTVYIQECSRSLDVDEKTLTQQVAKLRLEKAEKAEADRTRQSAHESLYNGGREGAETIPQQPIAIKTEAKGTGDGDILGPVEREIARYIVKYGMVTLNFLNDAGETESIPVIDYVAQEFEYESIGLSVEVYKRIYEDCRELQRECWESDYEKFCEQSLARRSEQWAEGQAEIQSTAQSLDQIKAKETALTAYVDEQFMARDLDFRTTYFSKSLLSSPDDIVRKISTDLASSKYRLSKVHSKHSKIETELDRLEERLPQAIFGLKDGIVQCRLRELRQQLKQMSDEGTGDFKTIGSIMSRIKELDNCRREFARFLGDRVVAPK